MVSTCYCKQWCQTTPYQGQFGVAQGHFPHVDDMSEDQNLDPQMSGEANYHPCHRVTDEKSKDYINDTKHNSLHKQ